MKNIRIGICGPSGTGKSTLAKYISEKYGVPFVTTSTKPLWEKYEIKSHEDLINKTLSDPKWGLNFQNEVLDYRIKMMDENPNFITDRTSIDNLVYFLLQNTHSVSANDTEEYILRCKFALEKMNGLICLPFSEEIQLSDDGARITNKYYQHTVNGTFVVASQLMRSSLFELKALTLPMWDYEIRKELTDKFIQTYE